MKTSHEYFVIYEVEGEKQTSYPFADFDRAVNLAKELRNTYRGEATIIEHTTFSD